MAYGAHEATWYKNIAHETKKLLDSLKKYVLLVILFQIFITKIYFFETFFWYLYFKKLKFKWNLLKIFRHPEIHTFSQACISIIMHNIKKVSEYES